MIRDISAVITAGGKSSRMGSDKALLEFDGCDTMCEYQYKKLKKIFEKVYISSKVDKFDFLESKDLILDNSEVFSPMVALEGLFDKIQDRKIFIISVDMPLVQFDTIKKLIELSSQSNYEIVIAKDQNQNRHSLCGVFDRSIRQKIKNCLSKDIHKINYLINNCSHKEILFKNSDQFINLNTKHEYIKAKNILKTAQI